MMHHLERTDRLAARLIAVALLLSVASGCDRSSPAMGARPAGKPVITVPANPALKALEGRWGLDGEARLAVRILDDGRGELRAISESGWRAELSNGRIEDGKLVYDQVNHHEERNRPFHGVRCRMTLEPVAGSSNQLRQTLATRNLQPNAMILERIP